MPKAPKKKSKPLVIGKLLIDVSGTSDHYSLMYLFHKAVRKQWEIDDEEFWQMLEEYQAIGGSI